MVVVTFLNVNILRKLVNYDFVNKSVNNIHKNIMKTKQIADNLKVRIRLPAPKNDCIRKYAVIFVWAKEETKYT